MCSCGRLAESLDVQVGVLDVAAHAEVGAVDLQHEAGGGDRLVLVAHRLGDGEEIGLVSRIVLVAEEQRDDAGRGGAHELPTRAPTAALRFSASRWAARGSRTAMAALHAGVSPPRAARIAEDPRGHLREIRQVAIRERMALSAEAGQPVLHVGGVARLAHLAVVDDIDAGLHLTTHHRGHRGRGCWRRARRRPPARPLPWRTSCG